MTKNSTWCNHITESAFANSGQFPIHPPSDAGPQSTRMRCYFHLQLNHFIDYFNYTVPDGAVINAGDILFHPNEQEGTYTEFLGNPTGNIFLAASRDHKFYSITEVLHCMPHILPLNLEV